LLAESARAGTRSTNQGIAITPSGQRGFGRFLTNRAHSQPMPKEGVCVYFDKPGLENTDDVVRAVLRRLAAGGLDAVVVASTSGSTGLRFAEATKGLPRVVVVSDGKVEPEFRERIMELGGVVIETDRFPLHKRGMDDVRNTLYAFGQGMKVAVEVILAATEVGLVEPYKDVVGVGGTERGADTAIVARSTTSREMFGKDSTKKLAIREVLAMPLEKPWWE